MKILWVLAAGLLLALAAFLLVRTKPASNSGAHLEESASREPPTRVAGLAGSVRALPYGQGRDFLRGYLRENMLSLSGFSVATRRLIYLAYALLVVMALWLLSLLLGEGGGSAQGSPSSATRLAVFVAFSVAWGFLLTGALYARRAVRLGVLFSYLVVTANWVLNPLELAFRVVLAGELLLPLPSFLVFILVALVGVLLLCVVPALFVLRPRVRLRLGVDFAILSLLVLLTYTMVHLQLELLADVMGDWFSPSSGPTLGLLLALAGLVFAFIGLDVAEIVYGVAGVTTGFASSRLRRRLLGGLLLVVLGGQLCVGVWETAKGIGGGSLWREASGNMAALGFPCIALVAWWLLERRRGSASDEQLTVEQLFEVAKKWALVIVAIFSLVFVVGPLLLLLWSIIPFVSVEIVEGLFRGTENYVFWQLFTAAVALAVGVLMARRGYRAVALYLTILGGSTFLFLFSVLVLDWWPERAGLGAGWARVDFWWAVAFALVGLFWLSRGRLTTERIQRLLLLSLVTFVLYWLGILYGTPNPEVGTIGLALVVIGVFALLWDLLTLGYWANTGSGGLPRLSRIFLYLGFVVVCVTSLDWAVMVGFSPAALESTAQQAPFGFMFLGRPLLYAIFVITLALPTTSMEVGESDTVNIGDQSLSTDQ